MDDFFLRKTTEWKVFPSPEQLGKINLFAEELLSKNEKINLVSRNDAGNLWTRHILDSIPFINVLQELNIQPEKLKVLDAGSGAGFPGIILSILLPDIDFTLAESARKKYSFLLWIKEKLKLGNAEIANRRLEKNEKFLTGFDVCAERAMGKIEDVLPVCLKTVKEGGFFAAWQNEENLEEIKRTKNPDFIYNYSISGEKKRAIFVFKK